MRVSIYSKTAFSLFLLLTLFSCGKRIDPWQEKRVETLLDEAERLTSQSRYDEAVSLAFEALKIADSGDSGDKSAQALSHLTLSKLFLQTSRDSLSFEHAGQAEDIAVQERDDSFATQRQGLLLFQFFSGAKQG